MTPDELARLGHAWTLIATTRPGAALARAVFVALAEPSPATFDTHEAAGAVPVLIARAILPAAPSRPFVLAAGAALDVAAGDALDVCATLEPPGVDPDAVIGGDAPAAFLLPFRPRPTPLAAA